jgi:hypothetical protein
LVDLRQISFGALTFIFRSILVLILSTAMLSACTQAETTSNPTPTIKPVKVVTVGLAGKSDAAGQLLEDVRLVSDDQMAVLILSAGSRLVDENGQSVAEIAVKAQPRWPIAYEFQPAGTKITPPAQLEICYDPNRLSSFERNNPPELGFFEKSLESWSWLEFSFDPQTHCISSTVERLGTFVPTFSIPQGIPKS